MNYIEMGIQAGLCDEEGRDDNSIIIEDHLKRFAKLVAAHEREACAKLCDDYDIEYDVNSCDTAKGIALEIRARGRA